MTQAEINAYLARSGPKQSAAGEGFEREGELKREVLDECRRRGWIALHGSMAHRTHRTIGEPDIVVIAERRRVILLELKSRTGKSSPEQDALHAWARKLGHAVYVIKTMDEFQEAVIAEMSREL